MLTSQEGTPCGSLLGDGSFMDQHGALGVAMICFWAQYVTAFVIASSGVGAHSGV